MHKPLAALAALVVALGLAACARSSQPAPQGPEPTAPTAGGEVAASPEPGGAAPCTGGQQWLTPGPGDNPLPAGGCYTGCDAAACPSSQVCRDVSTNPCGQTEDGQVKSCMAVSQQSRVCLSA